MTPAELCQAWQDLLKSKDIGQIYDLFQRKQKQLIEHLLQCFDCSLRIRNIFPMQMLTNDQLNSLNAPDFAKLIREVRKNYRAPWRP